MDHRRGYSISLCWRFTRAFNKKRTWHHLNDRPVNTMATLRLPRKFWSGLLGQRRRSARRLGMRPTAGMTRRNWLGYGLWFPTLARCPGRVVGDSGSLAGSPYCISLRRSRTLVSMVVPPALNFTTSVPRSWDQRVWRR